MSVSPRLPSSLVLVLGLAAAGCSSYTIAAPKEAVLHPFAAIPSSEGFARVCVIRTSGYYARAMTMPTWDNDVLVGATKGGTYFCYRAEPGRHVIRIKADGDTRVHLEAVAGRSYYLYQTMPFHFFQGKPKGEWLDESRARELIADSQYEVVVSSPADEPLQPQPILVKAASN